MSAWSRFTRPNRRVEGDFFTGTITAGAFTWQAELKWKNAHVGPGIVTALDENALCVRLETLNREHSTAIHQSPLKYVKDSKNGKDGKDAAVTERDAREAALVEQMRTDPTVTDKAYQNACRNSGIKPQARPFITDPTTGKAQASVEVEKSPYTDSEQFEINRAWTIHFLDRVHPELCAAGHREYNKEILLQWHRDEGQRAITTESLNRAYTECHALQFFRTPLVGKRGWGNASTVRPYDRSLILSQRELENPQPREYTAAEKYQEDKKEEARIEKLARDTVKNAHRDLRPGTSEFEQAVNQVLLSWARETNVNLGTRKKTATLTGVVSG